jgi:cell wall-associated NlpC family hydrolase
MFKHTVRNFSILVFCFLFSALLLTNPTESYAKSHKAKTSVVKKSSSKISKKHKRSKKHHGKPLSFYNPAKTRAEAKEFIQSSSVEISNLAGLEPHLAQQTPKPMLTDNSNSEFVEEGEDIAELEAEDDVVVNIDDFQMMWLSFVEGDDDAQLTYAGIKKQELMSHIMDWLGTPYHFGGTSDNAIDCSAFVREIFYSCAKIELPRTAREQINVGVNVKMNKLQFGDLVFFHTYSKTFASHVGIYLGDNLFAHASSRFGVTVSSLESEFYNKRFCGGRRLSMSDLTHLSKNTTASDDNLQ